MQIALCKACKFNEIRAIGPAYKELVKIEATGV
jgi:hypothetical protein